MSLVRNMRDELELHQTLCIITITRPPLCWLPRLPLEPTLCGKVAVHTMAPATRAAMLAVAALVTHAIKVAPLPMPNHANPRASAAHQRRDVARVGSHSNIVGGDDTFAAKKISYEVLYFTSANLKAENDKGSRKFYAPTAIAIDPEFPTVFAVEGYENRLFAMNPLGQQQWWSEFNSSTLLPAPTLHNGFVYVGSSAGVSATKYKGPSCADTGCNDWQASLPTPVVQSPTAHEGMLFVASSDTIYTFVRGTMHTLRPPTTQDARP